MIKDKLFRKLGKKINIKNSKQTKNLFQNENKTETKQ